MNRLAGALALALAACGAEPPGGAKPPHAPTAIADQEGAVCGMVVREQSAPRAQVVHRDGERAFVCSIGDLLAYLRAPSPHGTPEAVFVEVLDPDEEPLEIHLGEHRWAPADEAFYVVGVPRRSIMGEPVLAYANESDAAAVATRPGARILRFPELERWWLELETRGHP